MINQLTDQLSQLSVSSSASSLSSQSEDSFLLYPVDIFQKIMDFLDETTTLQVSSSCRTLRQLFWNQQNGTKFFSKVIRNLIKSDLRHVDVFLRITRSLPLTQKKFLLIIPHNAYEKGHLLDMVQKIQERVISIDTISFEAPPHNPYWLTENLITTMHKIIAICENVTIVSFHNAITWHFNSVMPSIKTVSFITRGTQASEFQSLDVLCQDDHLITYLPNLQTVQIDIVSGENKHIDTWLVVQKDGMRKFDKSADGW
jgi:hypothetical protein